MNKPSACPDVRVTLPVKKCDMPELSFKILRTVEEMMPYYGIVIQMPYKFDEATYRNYLEQMIPNGYEQMIALEADSCVALAGFWVGVKLYCGRYVELDNVVVAAGHQGRGIGKQLCLEIEAEARRRACTTALLDAYVENFAAHRFYFREGYIVHGYHFLKRL